MLLSRLRAAFYYLVFLACQSWQLFFISAQWINFAIY